VPSPPPTPAGTITVSLTRLEFGVRRTKPVNITLKPPDGLNYPTFVGPTFSATVPGIVIPPAHCYELPMRDGSWVAQDVVGAIFQMTDKSITTQLVTGALGYKL
jgi:hypothetical protein